MTASTFRFDSLSLQSSFTSLAASAANACDTSSIKLRPTSNSERFRCATVMTLAGVVEVLSTL